MRLSDLLASASRTEKECRDEFTEALRRATNPTVGVYEAEKLYRMGVVHGRRLAMAEAEIERAKDGRPNVP